MCVCVCGFFCIVCLLIIYVQFIGKQGYNYDLYFMANVKILKIYFGLNTSYSSQDTKKALGHAKIYVKPSR